MIRYGEKELKELKHGEMGIKTVMLGQKLLASREGGYFYLRLDTGKEER